MNEQAPTPTPNAQSTDALLDSLIDLLIYRDDNIDSWLTALYAAPATEADNSGKVRQMIRLGAFAGVDQSLMLRVTVAMARTHNLNWSTEEANKWVTPIYMDRQARVEFDQRIAQGWRPVD